MKMKLTLITICFLALCLNKSYAQISDPPSVASEPTAASLNAAGAMLAAAGIDVQFDKSISVVLNQFSAQISEDKQDKFKEIMKTFFAKYCSWEIIKPAICKMYAEQFTESEMKQLTTFYKTPLGIKLSRAQPVLLQKGMALGQQMVMLHKDDLQQMMTDGFK